MISRCKENFSWEKAAVVFLFLVGILLRLRQYLTGRSLWADEAMLALNIVNRTFSGLLRPLDYDQGAPIGFLLVEKISNQLFGRNEYGLRLLSLLAGLLSIWLFYLLLKHVITGAGRVTALALFVLNPRLVYYSSEVKQYIVDVVVTLALLLVAAPLFESKFQKRNLAWLFVAGFIAVWFSHPAIFVLAGIGLTLAILCLHRRDFSSLWVVLGMGVVWLATIGFLYVLVLNDISRNAYMREYWQGAFLPMPPWSDPGWFQRSLQENISAQFAMPYAVYLVFALILAGWFILWRTRQNYAIAFGSILLITLAASAVTLYPVFERMILFLVPIGLILLGKTVEFAGQKLQNRGWLGTAATLALAVFLIFGSLRISANYFIEPKYFEHIRPSLQTLREGWRTEDTLYVSNGAVPAFEFYAPLYGLTRTNYVSNSREDYQNPERISQQLETLKGKSRVWVLLSHVYEKGDFNEKDFILDALKQEGKMKREFRVPGTSVFLYLFDLR